MFRFFSILKNFEKYFSETLCTEPLRVGDCKQSVRQFWYNAETKTCESFLYTGCQGNNNRFNSLNECQSYCKNINGKGCNFSGKNIFPNILANLDSARRDASNEYNHDRGWKDLGLDGKTENWVTVVFVVRHKSL